MTRARPTIALALPALVLAVSMACDQSGTLIPEPLPDLPPADPCDQTALDDPRAFPVCGDGAGIFGRWIVDDRGLPAYQYVAAEDRDPRCGYPNTQNDDRRTHWFPIGNDRVNALAFNDGYVELLGQERGATFYDGFAPDQQNYGGGFGFVGTEDGDAWCTAYAFRPARAATSRLFGIGYVEASASHGGLRVTRRTHAPAGDAPLLLSDVTIEATDGQVHPVRWYEYWDVNRHPLTFELLRSGAFAADGDAQRDAENARFTQSTSFDGTTVRAHMDWADASPRTPRDAVSAVDDWPSDVFLTSLVGGVTDAYTDQAAFFGSGGPQRPDAVAKARPGEQLTGVPAAGQPAMLVLRSDVLVTPGAPAHLRYAYGYAPAGRDGAIDPTWRDPAHDVLADAVDAWRSRLAYFASPTDPVLHREVAWRSYLLQAASGWLDYFQTHVVAQGSAYLYSHGFDGAPRDHALFSMPLAYVDPSRARDLLVLVMEMTSAADGSIAYSYHGHGYLDSAAIHDKSSDLDIYFLMALVEYLSATGDRAFLDANVPFYPRGTTQLPPGASSDTVLDHARAALRHLVDVVGTGSHGLVKIGTGDWNDGITLLLGAGAAHDHSVAEGESHPDTAMAAFVLPMAADALATVDGALAAEMRQRAAAWLSALRAEWSGSWYPRAYLRDDSDRVVRVGDSSSFLWLETQPWALLAGAPDDAQRDALLGAIDARLDSPSPIGAMIQEPVAGNEDAAQVWPAVTGILTWAYARARPDLAWRAVVRSTYAAHAEAYPQIWYGVWSGPDGIQGVRSSSAGWTWSSGATPMLDFPVMNANPDAMGLLGVLRAAGVEPAPADGLRIGPTAVPGGRFVLDLPLLRLEESPGHVAGEYRAHNDGSLVLHFVTSSGGEKTLPLVFQAGDIVPFAVDLP